MHKAMINHTVAVDPKVIPIGSILKIDNIEYVAEDVGGAVKGKIIDIWVRDKSNSFGVMEKEVFIRR